MKISNGKWYWWSRGFGGFSALDYLMKVPEFSFEEAVQTLTGDMGDWKPPPPAVKKDEPKVLLLPPRNADSNRVLQYLFGRGIDYAIVQDCIADGTIYESADYHNAVFIRKDESGTPKYVACRGTMGSFKRDASGSDKRYSFRLLAREPTHTVHCLKPTLRMQTRPKPKNLTLRTSVWSMRNVRYAPISAPCAENVCTRTQTKARLTKH